MEVLRRCVAVALDRRSAVSSKHPNPTIMNIRNSSSTGWNPAKLVPGICALLFLGSCTTGPTEGEMSARAESDQLKNELVARDSLITEMALSFDAIERNIALMDEREKLLGENAEGELSMDKRQRIVRDVQLMNGLMLESRERIAELNKRLDKSKIDAGGLRKKLKDLDLMLASRDSSIATMKDELLARDFKIEQVNEQLTAIELEVARREAIIDQQTTQLNTGWYAMGTSKELQERGLVTKTGGFIGIGKQTSLNEEARLGQFKTLDVRDTKRMNFDGKKASLVTEHPKDSYSIVENANEMAYLEIKDPEAFWRLSKYMVVEFR